MNKNKGWAIWSGLYWHREVNNMKEQYEFKTEGKNTGIVKTLTLDNGKVLSETLVAYSGNSLKAVKASGKATTLKEV